MNFSDEDKVNVTSGTHAAASCEKPARQWVCCGDRAIVAAPSGKAGLLLGWFFLLFSPLVRGFYDSSPSVESSIRTSLISITEPAGLRSLFTRMKDTVAMPMSTIGMPANNCVTT